MAHGFEPFSGARFQQDCHFQNVSSPWEGKQVGKRFFQMGLASDSRLDPLDLTDQEVNGLFAALPARPSSC